MIHDLIGAIARFNPDLPMGVALSGGADSSALLLACSIKWPGAVWALHIHHGLQAEADDFERHCAALCDKLGVPLVIDHVNARHASGESPEDAARKARYRALAGLAMQHKLQYFAGAARRRSDRNHDAGAQSRCRAAWAGGDARAV